MYTAPFRYLRAKTPAEAETLFRESPDARYLAGGQTLIPTMKQRLAAPTELIDIGRIASLAFIRREGASLVVGAGTAHADVAASAEVRDAIPALSVLAGQIGDPAVRHKGTLGGSLANNDPAADYPAGVLALGATVKTTRRAIAADDFFTGMFETALEAGEIIAEVAFPCPPFGLRQISQPGLALRHGWCFRRGYRKRCARRGDGRRTLRVSDRRNGTALAKDFSPKAIADIAVPSDGLNSDLFGSAEYRAHLITVMAKRAVAAAML